MVRTDTDENILLLNYATDHLKIGLGQGYEKIRENLVATTTAIDLIKKCLTKYESLGNDEIITHVQSIECKAHPDATIVIPVNNSTFSLLQKRGISRRNAQSRCGSSSKQFDELIARF